MFTRDTSRSSKHLCVVEVPLTRPFSQGAPIAGYLLQAYGGEHSTLKAYHPAMFYAGSMALGSAGLVGLVRFYISRGVLKRL